MPDTPTILFDQLEYAMTRRQLLQALGAAALAIPASTVTLGAAGRGRAQPSGSRPVAPFEPTGWKTVWLDHLAYQCADYQKAAAFYVALMGWKVRSDNGTQAVLDMGEGAGSMIFRGGLAGPPPGALTDAGLGAGRAPVQAVFDGFAWGIEPWNTNTVKAELERRGLNPVADHAGADYQAFHIKDPDGFNLWVTNGTRALRRKTAANGSLKVTAPFPATDWKTVFVDHLSFEVSDYRRTTAFYQDLLGWQPRATVGPGPAWPDSPNSLTVRIGDIAGAIIRNGVANKTTATIGHISFGIDNWNAERVRAQLIERNIVYPINGQRIPRPDMAGGLESFHVPDAMGWDLQISNRVVPSP